MLKDHQSFQRFAAVGAILSFLLGTASDVMQGIPLNFSSEVLANPVIMLSIGANGASLMRWGLVLDMLGYYLPLLPVALFLQQWCSSRNPIWARFYTICGLGYILIGAVGAATLAAVHPPLIAAYGQASAGQRASLEIVFISIWNIVYGGLWNILGELLAGIWFLGIGLLLRSERRILGLVTMILGISALLDSLGTIFSTSPVASLGLLIFIALAPIWALWLGIDLLRKPVPVQDK